MIETLRLMWRLVKASFGCAWHQQQAAQGGNGLMRPADLRSQAKQAEGSQRRQLWRQFFLLRDSSPAWVLLQSHGASQPRKQFHRCVCGTRCLLAAAGGDSPPIGLRGGQPAPGLVGGAKVLSHAFQLATGSQPMAVATSPVQPDHKVSRQTH